MTSNALSAQQRCQHIVKWLKAYARHAKIKTFVVGISGGIDSSVVSALCARTGLKTIVVQLPIRQNRILDNRSSLQASWLIKHYPENLMHISLDMSKIFSAFEKTLEPCCRDSDALELALANSRARLRMMTLYQIAQSHKGLVVGTGNRVEDFGVGFFTKYGDGGVDISPIGDCNKTEVWQMGEFLALPQEIQTAPPTDGLWDDARTDQDQLGMTYPELEQAMCHDGLPRSDARLANMTVSQKRQLKRYQQLRSQNLHKMLPIPVCKFD